MDKVARTSTWVLGLLACGALGACGGRVSPLDSFGEETGGTIDSAVGLDGEGTDTSVGIDSGVVEFDTGVVFDGTSTFDTGVIDDVIAIDSGTTFDTGVVVDSGTIVDTGTVVDTGLVDTGVVVDTGPDSGVIDKTCASMQDAQCTDATKKCCTSGGVTYDDLGCRDRAGLWCKTGFDAVIGGKAIYDPTQLAACNSAWTTLESTCSIPILTWVKTYAPCSRLFRGSTPAGGACSYAFECAPPTSGGFADCDASSKRCRTVEVITTVGASCNYFGAAAKYCDYGMTCDYVSGGAPTCKKATPVGGSCFGTSDTSCGLGYVCKSGKCAVGAGNGASCIYDLECASWSCTLGKCTDPNFEMANKSFCYGG